MCRTAYGGSPPVDVINTFASPASLGTVTIPQRPGRVRLIVSMDTASSVIVFRDSLSVSNALVIASNPGPPLVLDRNHWGSLVAGQLVFQNKAAVAITLLITEHVESIAAYDHID